jgi:prepilin-type N-terminal cleavage/methylation domain-containing protein
MLKCNHMCGVSKLSLREVSPMSLRVGFTLIELLVVIAIIAILAAILFPVFSQAREKARQAQCTSNQRNMSMAAMQYINDYDEFLLPYEQWAGGWGQWGDRHDPTRRWLVRIQPYMRNIQVFNCPSGGDRDCKNHNGDGRP